MTTALNRRLRQQLEFELHQFDYALDRLCACAYPTGAAEDLIADLREFMQSKI